MPDFAWRNPARCIAIFNLFCSCVLVVLLAILLGIIGSGTGSMNYEMSRRENKNLRELISKFWIYDLDEPSSYLVPSVILVKATNRKAEPQKALRLTRAWIIVNCVYLVLGIFSVGIKVNLTKRFNLFNLLGLVVQLLFILVVNAYKKELGKKVSSKSNVKSNDRDIMTV